MKKAVRDLLNLAIFQHHAVTLGINQVLHGNVANSQTEKLSGDSYFLAECNHNSKWFKHSKLDGVFLITIACLL